MSSASCSSCGGQRESLHAKNSKLMPGVTLFLCAQCKRENKEPRYVIILAGRSNGPASVAEYIRKRRYCGDEILAKELIA